MPTTPQDRKPKAGTAPGSHTVKGGVFTFVGKDGQAYTLPPAAESLARLDFGQFLDAAAGGAAGQAVLAAQAMAVAEIDAEARAALRGLPMQKGAEVMGAWFASTGPDGVSLPQS